jgi:Arc/MetJ-type ribon-helix-helix transcriptional regulator
MTVELKPEQERIIREQLATGRYRSVDEVLSTALAGLPHDSRFDPEHRREAVRRMMEFTERRKLGPSLGEPVTRKFLHEGHRI